MKFSIITISYNQAAFLERTLRSVLMQSYPEIEYIVVDPGSTDGSRDIIERYRDRLGKVILEPDTGAADGLNKGFAASSGDVLGFLNSDDILFPGTVAAAARFFAKAPNVDVVSGHARILSSDDRVLRVAYSDAMSVKKYIYGGVVLIQPSTFFRREAYRRTGGFNVDNHSTWDGELFLEMARKGACFSRCDEIWSGYRLHGQSITASKRLQQDSYEQHVRLFSSVMGRAPSRLDGVLRGAFRIARPILNPRDAWERLARGPVYGRKLDCQESERALGS